MYMYVRLGNVKHNNISLSQGVFKIIIMTMLIPLILSLDRRMRYISMRVYNTNPLVYIGPTYAHNIIVYLWQQRHLLKCVGLYMITCNIE